MTRFLPRGRDPHGVDEVSSIAWGAPGSPEAPEANIGEGPEPSTADGSVLMPNGGGHEPNPDEEIGPGGREPSRVYEVSSKLGDLATRSELQLPLLLP